MNRKLLIIVVVQILAMATGLFAQGPTYHVIPVYPEKARRAGITGTVVLEGTIATDGTTKDLKYISGPEILAKSLMDAVSQWRYEPRVSDGKPIEVKTTISFTFDLPGAASSEAAPTSGRNNAPTSLSCPDWSAKFDQIEDPIMLDVLRKQRTNWVFDSNVRQGASYEAQIRQSEARLAGFQAAYERDEQTLKEMALRSKPTMSADDCLLMDPQDKSVRAVVCHQNEQRTAILMAEGLIELMRCRAGLSPQPVARPNPPAPASPSR